MLKPVRNKVLVSLLIAIVVGATWASSFALRGLSPLPVGGNDAQEMASNSEVRLVSFADLPVRFEPNRGQASEEVRYLARTSGVTLFFTDNEVILYLSPGSASTGPLVNTGFDRHQQPGSQQDPGSLKATILRYKLQGANPSAILSANNELAGKSNYFLGNEPAQWRTDVPNYASVTYAGVYPGIDMVWHGSQSRLEYDFVVAPGADPSQISLAVTGADNTRIESGEIVLATASGSLRQAAPRIYQDSPAGRQVIEGGYALSADGTLSFRIGAYDAGRALIIDPVLSYSTFLGGGASDDGRHIAVDAQGNAYIAGLTQSTNFPTQNPFQGTNGGGYDAFVSKFSADGSTLLYSTYLGGSGNEGENFLDGDNAVAVDSGGNAYVVGRTGSSNYPVLNAFQPGYGGGMYDAFVTKLNPTGNALVYSTYLGGSGSDYATGVAVDSANSAYIGGITFSTNFPTLNPYQPVKTGFEDAFVTKFNTAGNGLVYSTYLGGSVDAVGHEIAVDSQGSAYITGYTGSPDFPTLNAFQSTYADNNDAFLTKFTPAGNALVYSTYLGGSNTDFAFGLTVDAQGSAYVMGYSVSTNFPTQNAYQANNAGGFDLFLTRFSQAGNTLEYSTYIGGQYWDFGFAVAVDGDRQAYITGQTESANFPTRNPLQPSLSGQTDAVIVKFTAAGNDLVYSTFLGGNQNEYGLGIAADANGSAYVTGNTNSANFPTQNPYQPIYGGGNVDAFALKILDQGGATPTSTSQPTNTVTLIPTSTTTPVPSTPTNTPVVPSATSTSLSTATSSPTTVSSATPTACTLEFADVLPGNTFYANIRCLACRGIINGYPCGGDGEPCNPTNDPYFRPSNNITRGQLAKVVSQSAGFAEPITEQSFEDVAPSTTFFQYIGRLVLHDVMGGYPCGIDPSEPCNPPGNLPYFRPGANASRGQLTKIVSNAAGFTDPAPASFTFTDVPEGSTFHLFVERLLLNRPGAMNGYPCGSPGEPCDSENRPYFRPSNTLSRGQTSKIVANTFFPGCSTGSR